MSSLKIYIDINYPKRLVEALLQIHELQRIKQFEIIHWKDQEINENDLNNVIILFVNFQKRGLEIPILKHYEDGYKIVVCQTGKVEKLDLFEFAMTVLRVWPRIIEVSKDEEDAFLYSFNYGGKKLLRRKV